MSAETALQNVVSYSLQLGVLVGAGAALAAALRLEAPRWALAHWQGLLLAALALPAVQPWRPGAPTDGTAAADVAALAAAASRRDGLDWPRLALALVVAGVLLHLVRLGAGLRGLRRRRLRSRALPASAWDAAEPPGVGAAPRLFVSQEMAAPATYGALRPVVLLPGGFEALPVEQRRALLLHEALHVRRRHWLLLLAEEVVRAALWFHPAMAWLLARIRLCREQAVDRDVVRLTGSRRDYLAALVAMAQAVAGARPVPAPLFLEPSHLRRRVELLLKEVSMSPRRAFLTSTMGPAVVVLTASLAAAAFPFEGPPGPALDADGIAAGQDERGGAPAGGDRIDEKVKATAPKLVHTVPTAYPVSARKAGIEGDVVLRVRIETSGVVSSVTTLRGEAVLAEAATAAVRRWRYQPFDHGPVEADVTVRFTLARKKPRKAAPSPSPL